MSYLRLRQLCLVAPVLAPAVADVQLIFGLEVCYRDPNVGRYGLENALFPVGNNFVEIVAPTRAGTAAGRFLKQRNGHGGYMVIIDCDDARRRQQHAESLGIRTANLIQYEDYLGVQLHPRDTGAAIIEFNQTRGGGNIDGPYHPAGPFWQNAVRTEVTSRLVAVDVDALKPETFATRWGTLMERPVARSADGGYRLALDGGDIRFSQCPTVQQAAFSGFELRVVNAARVLDVAAARGYTAEDQVIKLCGVRIKISE